MLIWQWLRWLLLAGELILACFVVYLCVISFSAFLTQRRRAALASQDDLRAETQTTFAILIPAHNEEIVLSTLLESLAQLTYPQERCQVYVIADNCTDKTAALAQQFAGVQVYERFNQQKRGKGYALHWMWQQLVVSQLVYDAYIVLDADSVVIPTFLQTMSRELGRGARVLQARYTVLNATESPSTALRWVALTLMNHVRPLGRSGLGCSVALTGNGMCFSHEILQRYPWQAFGLSEDYQYYLTLVQHGERVVYVPEAIVRAQMPVTFEQMRTQDVRWESGDPQQSQWQTVWELLQAGLRYRSFVRLEAVAELLTPPLSLLVAACLLMVAVSLLLWFPTGLVFALLLCIGMGYYISTAFYLLHPPALVYKALLRAPSFVLWKLWVIFVLSKSRKQAKEWIRTERTSSS
jgi:cellulose synthase/poly-beta-1,6-N-acetylglucosamine synthase-like glycosyltransferase